MEIKGTYQDLEAFAKSRNIAQAVRAHNDLKVPLGMHDVFVLSYCSNASDDLHVFYNSP